MRGNRYKGQIHPSQREGEGRTLVHASKLEDTILADLDKRGIKYEYEPETFKYERPVRAAQCRTCGNTDVFVSRRYTPDLKLGVNGAFIEIKGKFTSENRGKMEDFLRGNPGFDLRFIFQRDNWLTSKHKTKYSDWAKKVRVKWHIGTEVPEEWLNTTA